MENMEIYKKLSHVPKEAKKPILAGRLKGKTDINPMWRIQALTEAFGPCGFGWRYEIVSQRLEPGDNDSVCAFVDINLYVKMDGEWSAAIPGVGGSSYIENERNGKYTSDECFKMALTDAISVACKALGCGADVYFESVRSKYTEQTNNEPTLNAKIAQPIQPPPVDPSPRDVLISVLKQRGENIEAFAQARGLTKNTAPETYIAILSELGVNYHA